MSDLSKLHPTSVYSMRRMVPPQTIAAKTSVFCQPFGSVHPTVVNIWRMPSTRQLVPNKLDRARTYHQAKDSLRQTQQSS